MSSTAITKLQSSHDSVEAALRGSAGEFQSAAMRNSWPSKTLGQLCQLVSGQHIEAKDYNTESRGLGYLTGPSDFGLLNPIISKWTEHPKVKAKRGDILITVKGSGVGKINLLDQDEVAISRQLMAVRVTGADPRFIHAILSSTFDHFQALSTGAAIPGISRDQVLGLKIALPSLPEQQRIVGILDEAFEGIATAKANAEKNLQNARALFESHLQTVFTQSKEGWKEMPLASLCSLFVDSAHRTPKYQSDGIPALRPRDVVNGTLAFTEAARVSEAEYEIQSRRRRPAPGDIVYSRELSYGWAAVLPESPRICLSQGMCLFRPKPDLDTVFLLYVLNGPVGREQAARAAVGTAHPHINLGDIKAYMIPFPSFSEQQRIVQQLDAIATETQRLESLYERKLAALEALKKSLLHQAFTGEL
jgi:type I restriction enzyme S subunit